VTEPDELTDDLPLCLSLAGHFPHLPPVPAPLGFAIEYRRPAALLAEPGKGHGSRPAPGRKVDGRKQRMKITYVRQDGTLVRK